MQTARRLYVYLLSGISLGVLVTGVTLLLTVLFDRLGLGSTGDLVFGGEETTRQQLTLASALIAVSLPVWLLHWLAAERSVRPERPTAAMERTSDVRGLYMALALGGLLAATASGVGSTVQGLVLRLTAGDQLGGVSGIDGGLALALAAGLAFTYHVRIRARDWSRGPMTGGGASLPRAYLYLATFAGLFVLLGAISGLIELAGRLLLDAAPEFIAPGDASWWTYPLASALSGLVVGSSIWIGHVAFADWLVRDDGWRGQSERPARLQLAYFVAVIAVATAAVIYFVAEGAGNALAAVLGVADAVSDAQVTGTIVLPLLTAVPYAGAWWLHARRVRRESIDLGSPERAETGDRLEVYPAALIGLAFGAVATAWMLSLLLEAGLGGGRLLSGDGWQREIAQFLPIALIGVAVWAWNWRSVGTRAAVDPAGEAASTTRRAALLLVLAASVLAGIISAGTILYRLFGSLFGIDQPTDALGELSLPIAGLVVAAAVAAYHGIALRADQGLRAGISTSPDQPASAPAAALMLRLSGPAEDDLERAVTMLRGHLAPGYGLEVTMASDPLPAPLPQEGSG